MNGVDIAAETLLFFLGFIAALAIFTIVAWIVGHWFGWLKREDDR